jgi:hypothetical protein
MTLEGIKTNPSYFALTPYPLGLINPSVFKPILATIENTLALKQLGALQDDDRLTLDQIIQDILGTD